jgi:hypothetical protein
MSNPTTTAAIARHHQEFIACTAAAHQCREWAKQYLAAAEQYDSAAAHAVGQISQALQAKWAAGREVAV